MQSEIRSGDNGGDSLNVCEPTVQLHKARVPNIGPRVLGALSSYVHTVMILAKIAPSPRSTTDVFFMMSRGYLAPG